MDDDDDPPVTDNVVPIAAAPKPSWVARLAHTKDGDVHPTLANALIIMAHDPRFRGMLGHNLFTDRRMLLREPPASEDGGFLMPGPYPRFWQDEDVSLVQAYMQRVWAARYQRNTIADAMGVTAMSFPFHPVRDWIAGLKWDGVKRLDNWLLNAFDARNDEIQGSDAWKQATGLLPGDRRQIHDRRRPPDTFPGMQIRFHADPRRPSAHRQIHRSVDPVRPRIVFRRGPTRSRQPRRGHSPAWSVVPGIRRDRASGQNRGRDNQGVPVPIGGPLPPRAWPRLR